MKLSNDFDARRLRPRAHGRWRLRVGLLLAVLGMLTGLVSLLLAALSLLHNPLAFTEPAGAATVLLASGTALLGTGLLCWRRCRRRQRGPEALNMAPHLLKKRH